MKIFRFIAPTNDGAWLRLLSVSILAGAANAGILMVVNYAARSAYGTITSVYLFFIFLLAVAIYYFAQRRAFDMVASDVEDTVLRTRVRILELVQRCELMGIEAIGEARILSGMTAEAQRLSQAMSQVTAGLQSILVTLMTGAYIAWLSRPAFALWVFVIAISTYLILREWGTSQRLLTRAGATDGAFQDITTALLHGFKEVKLSSRRAAAIFAELSDLAQGARDIRTEAQHGMGRSYVVGQVLFFLLVGSMVFLLPALGDITSATLEQATTAVLFVLGPVSMIIGSIPALSTAEASAATLVALENALVTQVAAEGGQTSTPAATGRPGLFHRLELSDIAFHYPQSERGNGFMLGPLNFHIDAGEIVFITGGNGAGKSTFLRVLTGLYRPQSGQVRLNGRLIDPAHQQNLRDQIAAVFADYFLFQKLYGIDVPEDGAVDLLDEMEIADKSQLQDGAFTHTALSTGQRKRLALIAAVLEGKPLLVLDEWAADQDPVFRRKFYEVILPALKRRGITIIAATHDDRWFHLADRHIRLADGQIQAPTEPATPIVG